MRREGIQGRCDIEANALGARNKPDRPTDNTLAYSSHVESAYPIQHGLIDPHLSHMDRTTKKAYVSVG